MIVVGCEGVGLWGVIVVGWWVGHVVVWAEENCDCG